MQFGEMQKPETKYEKVKRVIGETIWVVGTSIFVLGFPIYAATKL